MFKKILLGAILLLSYYGISKADSIVDNVGPSSSTITATLVRDSSTTVISPGVGFRNCLTELDISPVATATTVSVRNNFGGTALWSVNLLTTATQPFSRTWDPNNPLCVGYNDNLTVIASTGIVNFSYRGQVRGNR